MLLVGKGARDREALEDGGHLPHDAFTGERLGDNGKHESHHSGPSVERFGECGEALRNPFAFTGLLNHDATACSAHGGHRACATGRECGHSWQCPCFGDHRDGSDKGCAVHVACSDE